MTEPVITIPAPGEYDTLYADLIDVVSAIEKLAIRLRPITGLPADRRGELRREPDPDPALYDRATTLADVGAAFDFAEGLELELNELRKLCEELAELPGALNGLRRDAEAATLRIEGDEDS
jgi:hypothetical protein